MNIATNENAITWAVYLGCTTASRLAREWGISKVTAGRALRAAHFRGQILRVARGQYLAPRVPDRYDITNTKEST